MIFEVFFLVILFIHLKELTHYLMWGMEMLFASKGISLIIACLIHYVVHHLSGHLARCPFRWGNMAHLFPYNTSAKAKNLITQKNPFKTPEYSVKVLTRQ